MSEHPASRPERDHRRRVVAFCNISIDGYSSGRRGPAHDAWLYEHAGTEESERHLAGIWRQASTVVMGRANPDGFGAVWPGLANNPELGHVSRAYGHFLLAVEKVAFSRTLPPNGPRPA